MGHALVDVTSGRDVLSYFHCWLLNDLTCNVLHGLHIRCELCNILFDKQMSMTRYFGTWCEVSSVTPLIAYLL